MKHDESQRQMDKNRPILVEEQANSMEVAESLPTIEVQVDESEVMRTVVARPSVFFLAGAVAGGNVISSFLRMIGGILQARLVPPSVLGLYTGI
ncbi:MAG TPA: hypothetical protein VIH42_02450, partial [Thermoguttaceae bacterium]